MSQWSSFEMPQFFNQNGLSGRLLALHGTLTIHGSTHAIISFNWTRAQISIGNMFRLSFLLISLQIQLFFKFTAIFFIINWFLFNVFSTLLHFVTSPINVLQKCYLACWVTPELDFTKGSSISCSLCLCLKFFHYCLIG